MYAGPWRSSAEVVITASAPTSRYLTTCSAVSTPLVAASEALILPASMPIQSSGRPGFVARAQLQLGLDGQRGEVEVGLVEAVEQHEPVGAGVDELGAPCGRSS